MALAQSWPAQSWAQSPAKIQLVSAGRLASRECVCLSFSITKQSSAKLQQTASKSCRPFNWSIAGETRPLFRLGCQSLCLAQSLSLSLSLAYSLRLITRGRPLQNCTFLILFPLISSSPNQSSLSLANSSSSRKPQATSARGWLVTSFRARKQKAESSQREKVELGASLGCNWPAFCAF